MRLDRRRPGASTRRGQLGGRAICALSRTQATSEGGCRRVRGRRRLPGLRLAGARRRGARHRPRQVDLRHRALRRRGDRHAHCLKPGRPAPGLQRLRPRRPSAGHLVRARLGASGGGRTAQTANAPGPGETTLIWTNLVDLSPNSQQGLSYRVAHDPSEYAVGDSYTNSAGVFVNCDPVFVPEFDPQGNPVQSGGSPDCSGTPRETSYTGFATDSATTTITAIEIEKSEGSPEGEILRGLHDHPTDLHRAPVTNNLVKPPPTPSRSTPGAGRPRVPCLRRRRPYDRRADQPGFADGVPGRPGRSTRAGPPGGLSNCVAPSSRSTVNADPDGAVRSRPASTPTSLVSLADLRGRPGRERRVRRRDPDPREHDDWNGAAAGNGACRLAGACSRVQPRQQLGRRDVRRRPGAEPREPGHRARGRLRY